MKKIILSLIIHSTIISLGTAQKIDRPKGSLAKVEIYNLYGNIVVIGTDKNQIEVELLKNNEIPYEFLENTLNRNYQYKQSNSSLDLNLSESGTILRIYPSSKMSQFSDYQIKIPKDFIVKIKNDISDFGGYKYTTHFFSFSNTGKKIEHEINIENILSDIEIETNFANINAKNIAGPIVATSFDGSIKIVFNKLNQELPSSIEAFRGDIDITLPSDSNCDITMIAAHGNLNYEFHINDIDPDFRPIYSTTYTRTGKKIEDNSEKLNRGALKGKINKGGVDMKISTSHGNINLNKR